MKAASYFVRVLVPTIFFGSVAKVSFDLSFLLRTPTSPSINSEDAPSNDSKDLQSNEQHTQQVEQLQAENQQQQLQEEVLQLRAQIRKFSNSKEVELGSDRKDVLPSDPKGNRDVPVTIQKTRRTKFHVCYHKDRSASGQEILQHEFGFDLVDAREDNGWDVIYGGYPWCGEKGDLETDYKMESGLNKQLLHAGFENLKPHQVYFPCMGCPSTFCNKRELCRMQRSIDPESCYLLLEDYDALKKKIDETPGSGWVLKHDMPDSAIHSGSGVEIMFNTSRLTASANLEKYKQDSYLVQPLHRSYLGEGPYRRTTEVRYYVAITSVSPLRVYYFNDQWMPLSSTLWIDNPPSKRYWKCMMDSHVYKKECSSAGVTTSMHGEDRHVRFTEYQNITGMPKSVAERFHKESIDTMIRIFQKSQPILEGHAINQGIASSGASCFSFMRADFGIGPEGGAFLFEVNEFPWGREPKIAGAVQKQAYRELFRMIGLVDTPLSVEDRAAYEAEHSGNWTLLPTL